MNYNKIIIFVCDQITQALHEIELEYYLEKHGFHVKAAVARRILGCANTKLTELRKDPGSGIDYVFTSKTDCLYSVHSLLLYKYSKHNEIVAGK